ncbi:MAG: GNAT family N-acetyltransferase [candidate division Zixibacteria bacterium]|nr:GNAT family N-acetyltransferase [candidate division Zixibacteria bacterium]MDH3939222.1 GNAT family N-acetyltransferase [candidate division Zixibacteria bacterium]
MSFTIKKVTDKEREWVLEIARGWGADFIISRARRIYPAEIEGYYAVDQTGKRVGLVTYEVTGDQCEVVTLDAFDKFRGVGTALLDTVRAEMPKRGVERMWLITTNDNLDAIRFYQRRGWTIATVHVNALAESRRMKPSISEIGMHGIPLRDEIEFELLL